MCLGDIFGGLVAEHVVSRSVRDTAGAAASAVGAGRACLDSRRGAIGLAFMPGVIALASMRGVIELASMRGMIGLGSIFGTTVEWRIFHTPPSRTSTSVQRPSTFSGPSCPRPVISYLPTEIAASVPNGET